MAARVTETAESSVATAGLDWLDADPRVRHRYEVPARRGELAAWPAWVPDVVVASCRRIGIEQPWAHQVAVAEAAHAGRHVVVSTPTASGKSLAYLLPVMAATYEGKPCTTGPPGLQARSVRRPHTTLYLAPTKALAHDQLRGCRELGLDGWRVSTLDGDSDGDERAWARDHAAYVLTNPDMVHRSMLPNHTRWSQFLAALRYVVIDECHRYRGVFGSHVAAVLRRLRRLCASYGSEPLFLLASATVSDAGRSAAELLGVDPGEVTVVDQDTSPAAGKRLVLWQPSSSAEADTAELLARLVTDGDQTIAFVPSRRMAEWVACQAREAAPGRRIDAYRSGYLATDRRQLEQDLQTGALRGVAATNALELGVDVAGMGSVVICGFPGTRAAFWQQAGRAGRAGKSSTVVLVARPDPLDAFLLEHPDLLVAEPVEATVLHAANPYILGPHLAAAAQELPLTPNDERWFGSTFRDLTERLTTQGTLRQRSSGWYWTRGDRAVDGIDLRSAGRRPVEIVDTGTGRVLGHCEAAAADATVHPGAVYLHQTRSYLVDSLELDEDPGGGGEALVHEEQPGYLTQPQRQTGIRVLHEQRSRRLGSGEVRLGQVEVSSQVTGYLRRDVRSGTVWDSTPLELPLRRLRTVAVWWTLDLADLPDSLSLAQLAAGAHAAEHASLGLLPAFAPCDRWDVGGVSLALHPDTGRLTVFVHDGHPGGAGFAERGYAIAEDWLAATLERLRRCACEVGCPACVVSPKCGNGNAMLDKSTAAVLLARLVG